MATANYDVIIIGGGINGAATAASVAARGYRTLVLEQDDFASGTTSASTKLIHGGLRYLETGDARLVHESLQSRERLLRERPHLVRPMGFILPVYEGDPRPPWYIRSGLALYDLLSPRKVSPWHSSFSERELQRFEPSISTDQLRAAFLYHDAQVWSPERLTLEYLAEARASGADLRNHAAVDYIIVDGGRARGVDFHDVLTGRRSTASGRLVINAAGPWVDAVLDATGRSLRKRIGGTRGSHLVVDLNGRGPKHAVLASAKSDGRPMFVTPWLEHHIIGTTDVRDDEDPSDVRAAGWEIDYLIAEAARVLPGLGIEHRNVLYAYSGVRPLTRAGEGVFEGAISRRSIIADHASEGVERLVSVVGGKLTTAAKLGRKVAESVAQQIGRPRARGIAALPRTSDRSYPPDRPRPKVPAWTPSCAPCPAPAPLSWARPGDAATVERSKAASIGRPILLAFRNIESFPLWLAGVVRCECTRLRSSMHPAPEPAADEVVLIRRGRGYIPVVRCGGRALLHDA